MVNHYLKMRQKTVIIKFLKCVTKVYCKVRQILQSVAEVCYKVCQISKSVSGITQCNRGLLQNCLMKTHTHTQNKNILIW